MLKGFFVAIDGNDGSGKSTIIKLLSKDKDLLNLKKIFTSKEPFYSDEFLETIIIYKQLVNELTNKSNNKNFLITLWFTILRKYHIKLIKKYLNNGYLVLTDRYLDSTIAYQLSKNNNFEVINSLHVNLCDNFLPNLTILLLTNPKIATKRISNDSYRKNKIDKLQKYYDNTYLNYQNIIFENYQKITKLYNHKRKIVIVDNSNMSINKTFIECKKIITSNIYEKNHY